MAYWLSCESSMNSKSDIVAVPVPPLGRLASIGAAEQGGARVPDTSNWRDTMGDSGTGLRSREYEVRILAAAQRGARRPRALIPHPTESGAWLVPLTRGFYATIDAEDAPLIGMSNWCAAPTAKRQKFYATTSIGGRMVPMHRVLMAHWGSADCEMVDHKDGDTLNNRRSNLRPATRTQNNANSQLSARNTNGFKGIKKNRAGRWEARIRVAGEYRHLGTFPTKEAAAGAYWDAAQAVYGEFARAS